MRTATEADVPQLLLLIRDLTAVDPHNGLSKMTAGLLRIQAFRRQPPTVFFLVAEVADGTLVGFLAYWFIGGADGQTVRVMSIFVSEHARRQGAGRDLMRALAIIACNRADTSIAWGAADMTVDAAAFAARLGAELLGDGREYRLANDALHLLAIDPVSTA